MYFPKNTLLLPHRFTFAVVDLSGLGSATGPERDQALEESLATVAQRAIFIAERMTAIRRVQWRVDMRLRDLIPRIQMLRADIPSATTHLYSWVISRLLVSPLRFCKARMTRCSGPALDKKPTGQEVHVVPLQDFRSSSAGGAKLQCPLNTQSSHPRT